MSDIKQILMSSKTNSLTLTFDFDPYVHDQAQEPLPHGSGNYQ